MSSQTVVGFGSTASAARGIRSRRMVGLLLRGALLGCLAGVVCLVAGAAATAEVLPPAVAETDGLNESHGLRGPVDTVIFPDGGYAVTDYLVDRVIFFNRRGERTGMFRVVDPLSISATSDGSVYVASKEDRSVALYTRSGDFVRYLGSGNGEFRLPVSIDVDHNGQVYVLDYLSANVKIFDGNSGARLAVLGGYGPENGRFQAPTGIAVDSVNGEIFVVDRGGLTKDPATGETIPIVRVQVIDAQGTFLRRFAQFGVGDGNIYTPTELALDGQGRLYVADNRQACVQVFSTDGASLGHILPDGAAMRTPTGLAFGNSRLIVTSQIDKTVFVFGIDNWVELNVSPQILDIRAQELKAPIPAEAVVSNGGAGSMDWSARGVEPWLSVSPAGGTLGAGEGAYLSVTADHSGMPAGGAKGSVVVSDGRGVEEAIDVWLTILAAAQLTVHPASLEFQMLQGGADPAPQLIDVHVMNDLPPAAAWEVAAEGDFLQVSSGGVVSVSGQGRQAGTYGGLVTVSSQQTVPSLVEVPVTLLIEPPPTGNVKVIANIPQARFSLVGTEEQTAAATASASATTSGSGMEWVYEDVNPGSYTLNPGDVPRYRTPAAEDVVVIPGETTVVEVEYVRRPVDDIVVGSAANGRNDTVVRVYGPGGVFQGITFEAFPGMGGGVNLAVADLTGDGRDEIIAALTGADKNPAQIAVFDQSGSPVPNASAVVFDASRRGANVAAGDFDADGSAEIVVGTDDEGVPTVRVLGYDGVGITDTGIMFSPLSWPAPIGITTADVDGDGTPEILAWARGGLDADCGGIAVGNSVYVWRVSGSDLEGWSAVFAGRYLSDSGIKLMTAAAGDITGDGAADPVLIEEDGRATFINGATGQVIQRFASVAGRDEVIGGQAIPSAALADIDADGSPELLVGPGDHSRNWGNVNVFDGGGGIRYVIQAFPDARGATVAVGDLGDIGQEVR